jgi:competence ComEA-like helix-hairpin-helix protein
VEIPASHSAAGLIVAALAVVALASQRGPAPAETTLRAPPLPASNSGVRALREGQSLELNRAAAGDLVLLPGVGPKLAQRIVQERERRGGFTSLEQLLEVKGIGHATLAQLARFVRITPPLTDRAASSRSNSR